jgi:PAS domain S-box-containing protein
MRNSVNLQMSDELDRLRQQAALEATGLMASAEDETRKQYMTETILKMMGMALLVFTTFIGLGWATGYFDLESVAIMLLMDIPIGMGWWLARRGHWRWGSWIAPAVMFALAVYGTYVAGLVNTLILFYVIAILLTSMLQGGKAQWFMLALCISVHLGIGMTRTPLPWSDRLAVAITISGSFLGIALLQWFSTSQLQLALARTRASAEVLREEIHERKRTEEALQESEKKLRAIIEQSSEGIMLADEQGRIIEWNPAHEKLTGLKRDEVMGVPLWEIRTRLMPPEHRTPADSERLKMAILNALLTGQSTQFNQPVEVVMYTKDGDQRFILQTAFPISTDQGYRIGSVTRDITARRQAEIEREKLIAELEAKNTELESFTYTVSHDLKAPLITVRGFLGFLEKDAAAGNTERLKADISRITEATDKMQTLLSELLELSRIGRMMNPSQAVPFETVAHEAVELVHGRIQARGVQVGISGGLPIVYGDRARLVQVVQNLVDNACKFMGDQAEPRIDIGQRGLDADGKPVFFVRDNGLGIEPQYHERVFGLFDKLDAKTEGTGVGLALVKRIVEVHGGRIWVESEGKGKGSTFYFTIPANDSDRP